MVAQEYYYPYCGYKRGWCKSKGKCKMYDDDVRCKFFALRHPVSGLCAVMMPEDTKAWLKELVKGDNGESKRKT